MEHVKAFQSEMDSLFKSKPPISKAKMSSITKSAMKAIKMYKHVVQAVEKFVNKCKPEYKVPGLYIMDSIIRQSRHQYGIDKDLFAARFCKNICTTFQSLYKCPESDKSKILRVLNLWQKNAVLPTDVIQPLMDLAKDPQDPAIFRDVHKKVEASTAAYIAKKPDVGSASKTESNADVPSNPMGKRKSTDNSSKELEEATGGTSQMNLQQMQLLQLKKLQEQLLDQTAQLSHVQGDQVKAGVDTDILASLQQLTNQLIVSKSEQEKPVIDKKLLDYDYGESDEDEKPAQPGENVQALQEAMLIEQLKRMNEALTRQKSDKAAAKPEPAPNHLPAQGMAGGNYQPTPISQLGATVSTSRLSQGEEYDPMPPASASVSNSSNVGEHNFHAMPPQSQESRSPAYQSDRSRSPGERGRDRYRDGRDRDYRDRNRRSRSRDKGRRDRSRERRERDDRRAKEDKERRDREDREREEREKERQRRKLGLPPFRPGHVIICSCTLWIGHLAKHTTERDLSELCGEYGNVTNIFLIRPRGCAYVTLEKRVDAHIACVQLQSVKLLGNRLKVAWAPPKSINEDKKLKDFWEVKDGAAFIPWGQMPPDLAPLTAGGEAILDESSVPGALTVKPKPMAQEEVKMDLPELGMDLPQLPGFGGMINSSVPPQAALAGGALPPLQPGQVNPVVTAQSPQLPPGVHLPAGLTPAGLAAAGMPGMQMVVPGQPAASVQGLVPMQMADGQVRLVRPPGMLPTLPPGLNPPQQLPPGMAPAGHGLVQLPPGLVPLRPIMPQVSLAGGQAPGGSQLEQALHDLMNNKAQIQALAGQHAQALPVGLAPQMAPMMIPTSIQQNQAAFLQASIAQTGQLPMPQVNSAPTIGMAGAVQPNMAIPPPGLSVPAGAAGPMGAVEPQGSNRPEDNSADRARHGSPPRPSRNFEGNIQVSQNRLNSDDENHRGQRGSMADMRGPPPDMAGLPPNMRRPPPDMRGPPPDMRGPPPDMRGPPPDMRNMHGMRGQGPGMWRGDRPPFNPRGPPPHGWSPNTPPRPGFSPRGQGPKQRFPFDMNREDNRSGRDEDFRRRDNYNRDRDFDRGRDGDRGRHFDKERDDRTRGFDRDRDRDFDRKREYDRRGDNENDRNRFDRSRDSQEKDSLSAEGKLNSLENGEDERKSKRSRWSNDIKMSSGLDDASEKLAKNTALEIAAKLANISNQENNVDEKIGEEDVPSKPLVDITKVDTQETVSNVLGQLYDDEDEDDENEDMPAVPPALSAELENAKLETPEICPKENPINETLENSDDAKNDFQENSIENDQTVETAMETN